MVDPYKLTWADQEVRPGNSSVPAGDEKYYLLASQVNELRDQFNEVADKATLLWQTGYEATVCWYPDGSGNPEFYSTTSDLADYSTEQPGTGIHWTKAAVGGGDMLRSNNLSDVTSKVTAAHTILDGVALTSVTPAATDEVLIQDASDSSILKTVTFSDITGGGGASQLSDLTDVGTSTVTDKNVLVADGSDFKSRALLEADISDLGTTILENSDIGGSVQAHSAILDATTASFTTADESKLDAIETGATADQTGAQIKAAYEAEVSAFTDAQFTKLAGIETGATADQSDGEIKTAYENNADTNAFTNADESKLDGIEASADVTDTANVTAAGALMDSEVDADLKTLTLPANTTITAFAATLLDDATQGAAQTTLDVDPSGTDNSTPVTLAGTPQYLALAGQVLTRNQIDLTADVTGVLPIANIATGTPDGTKYVRDDGTLVTPPGGGGALNDLSNVTSTTPAKGDILVYNGSGWVEGPAVGTDGQILTADSGEATGLIFSDPPSGSGDVVAFGGPADEEIAIWTNSTTVEGRDAAGVRTLLNVEDGATADQSDTEIKTAYENNTNTNPFTDANSTTLGTALQPGGALGTPSSGTATNLTGTAAGLTAGAATTLTSLTATVTELNNATDLSGLTAGDVYSADSATTASWKAQTGGSGDPDQNIYETVAGDTVSTTASTTTDTLTIAGGTGITTLGSPDTITITNDSPNVSTTLSAGTITATTYGITSDGGADDIVLPEANTNQAGLLGADKWDEIVANTAKVTNATHSGQVDGATTLALNVTAITDQPASGAITATDTILTNDGGVLSETTFTQLNTYFDSSLSFGAGTVTDVTGGTGIASTGGATPDLSLTVDELAEKTGAVVGTDRIVGTTGTTNWSETISGIPLSIFNNDSNFAADQNVYPTIEGDTGSNTAALPTDTLWIAGGTGITTFADGDDSLIINIDASQNTITSATSLAAVGTITTGVWTGTDIAVADGGTGASTAAGARTNLDLEYGIDVVAKPTVTTKSAPFTTADGDFGTVMLIGDADTPTLHATTISTNAGRSITFISTAATEITIAAGTTTMNGNTKINQNEAVTAICTGTGTTTNTVWYLIGGSA